MKKTVSLILILAFLIATSVVPTAMSFPDVDGSHWALEYISALINDGTINGFEDGTFRPGATVTRAQFVKMIGKGQTRKTTVFSDVTPEHWGYEYIMTSELEGMSADRFEPDTPITRNDVVNLLWLRAGKPSGALVPPNINSQGTNIEAVSWAYSTGLVVGNDYINLRLSDSLTRAEASKLIICSRQIEKEASPATGASSYKREVSYFDKLDSNSYESAYNAFAVVDKPYSPDDTITNGELAMAAVRIICDEASPSYQNISSAPAFEHKYARPLSVLCRYYLGDDKNNAAYADAPATVRDTILALMFATMRTSLSLIKYDASGPTYSDASTAENDDIKLLLAAAYQNGVQFDDKETVSLTSPITMKQFACLLIEFDGMSGFYTAKEFSSGGRRISKDCKLNVKPSSYPQNADQFNAILSDVPNYVYESPFAASVQSPKESFYITNQFRVIFENMCSQIAHDISNKGAEVTITSYPGLSWNNDNGYTLRVKLTVDSLSTAKSLSDVIKCANDSIGALSLYEGLTLFLDIDTGKVLDDVVFPSEYIFVSQYVG